MAGKQQMEDLQLLLIRSSVSLMLMLHGIAKLRTGIAPITRRLQSAGMPGFISYGVFVGELIAPALVLVGLYSRPAAAVMAFNMVFATLLVHSRDVFQLSRQGGWAIELQALYLVLCVAVMLCGAGRYSLSRGRGRWD